MNTVVAKDLAHLKSLVAQGIAEQGNNADLNYIDTSKVVVMDYLFDSSSFNGDISKWNVSKCNSYECYVLLL